MPVSDTIHWKVTLDLICVLIVGLPSLMFLICGSPFHRGYFCDDETIRYPLVKETIPNTVLYVVGIGGSVVLITLVEIHLHYRKRLSYYSLYLLNWEIPPLLWRLYVSLGYFIFGACVTQFITDVAKYSIGRLRPNFMATCQPSGNCSYSSQEYIIDYHCQNSNEYLTRESRLSFLSGHASFSFYAAVYLVLFLQKKEVCNFNKLLKPVLQSLLLMLAWFTALTRVSDYKHHPQDVLAGIVVGSFAAIIMAYFISDIFRGGHPSKMRILSEETPMASYNGEHNQRPIGPDPLNNIP